MAEQAPTHAPIFNPIPTACLRLGIGRTFLYEEIAAGKIKTVKVGKRRLIPESELHRYASEQQIVDGRPA